MRRVAPVKSRLVWLVRDDGCVDPDLRRLLESSAWEVVEYVTSQSALDAAAPSAPAVILLSLDSTSTDPGELLDTFTNAVARPSRITGDRYNEVSSAFFSAVHSVLSGEAQAAQALEDLEADLNRMSRGGRW